jgi:hypothetical protein
VLKETVRVYRPRSGRPVQREEPTGGERVINAFHPDWIAGRMPDTTVGTATAGTAGSLNTALSRSTRPSPCRIR